ncbi:MAG: LemA family protein [Candidatus Peregrinibacteria bacterium]
MIYALLIVAVLAILIVGIYNSLVKLRNKCKEAWSDIDTQLKRRYDLIPNLVETVKGYASHEAGTLEKVTEARSKAMQAKTVAEKENAENMISSALKTIFALAENYPDLKANQNFLDLQKTLSEIEEHIQLSRRYYNGTVRDFNTRIEIFPNNLLAKVMGFTAWEFFQATDEEKAAVKVSFKEEQKPAAPEAPPAAPQAPPATPQAPPAEAPQPPEAPKPPAPPQA